MAPAVFGGRPRFPLLQLGENLTLIVKSGSSYLSSLSSLLSSSSAAEMCDGDRPVLLVSQTVDCSGKMVLLSETLLGLHLGHDSVNGVRHIEQDTAD